MRFKLKQDIILNLLTPETMKWLETSKSKLVKETGGNEPHLEVFKVLFIHCNIVNNNYLQHSRV